MVGVLSIVVRSVVVYLFILIAIRIFGKKELSQLSVIDLVFILLISNSVQNAMVGSDSSLLGGIVAALSLFTVNIILENVFFRSRRISQLIQGDAIMLVYHGRAIISHLAKAKITHNELEAVIREHGVADISKVDLAVLETDGNISVLSENFTHHTVKKRRAHKVIGKNE